VALERLLESARGRIPELYSFITRAGRQQPAIGGEGHRLNPVCVALKHLLESAHGQIPELYSFIIQAGC
jgi:hypothetical protein